ncbi:hypothetical protein L1887_55731 [Cichorium endivia]|nr:hypothetical protein L1887_55731 [Cichorium endivia]
MVSHPGPRSADEYEADSARALQRAQVSEVSRFVQSACGGSVELTILSDGWSDSIWRQCRSLEIDALDLAAEGRVSAGGAGTGAWRHPVMRWYMLLLCCRWRPAERSRERSRDAQCSAEAMSVRWRTRHGCRMLACAASSMSAGRKGARVVAVSGWTLTLLHLDRREPASTFRSCLESGRASAPDQEDAARTSGQPRSDCAPPDPGHLENVSPPVLLLLVDHLASLTYTGPKMNVASTSRSMIGLVHAGTRSLASSATSSTRMRARLPPPALSSALPLRTFIRDSTSAWSTSSSSWTSSPPPPSAASYVNSQAPPPPSPHPLPARVFSSPSSSSLSSTHPSYSKSFSTTSSLYTSHHFDTQAFAQRLEASGVSRRAGGRADGGAARRDRREHHQPRQGPRNARGRRPEQLHAKVSGRCGYGCRCTAARISPNVPLDVVWRAIPFTRQYSHADVISAR